MRLMEGNVVFGKFRSFKRHWRVWLRTSSYSTQTNLVTRGASLMYIAGKLIRFFFFFYLLNVIGEKQQEIAGYSLNQMITFFLIFNLFDIIGQVLFRGIYSLRGEIISGQLDFKLIKPLNTLFQVLTGNTDLLDLPLLIIIIWLLWQQRLVVDGGKTLFFLGISVTSFLLVLAIHVLVASVGILTTEVDNMVLIYRDLSIMARVPIDIYINPVRVLLTFVVPIGIIMTFPAKALMGLLSWQWVIGSFLIGGLFLLASLRFWQYALKKYSPASS